MRRLRYLNLNIDGRDTKLDWDALITKRKLHETYACETLMSYREQILNGATTSSELEDSLILGFTRLLKELRQKRNQLFMTITKPIQEEDTLFSYRLGIISGENWIEYDPPVIWVKTRGGIHLARTINPRNPALPEWQKASEHDIPIPFDNLSSIYGELNIRNPSLRLIPGNGRIQMFFENSRNNFFPLQYFTEGHLQDYDLSFIEALMVLNYSIPEEFLEARGRHSPQQI